jgi:LmbE family N-acetylglucosaminyl deacetylase
MATAVFFHAHPDDESIATGGTMARMAEEGHRVVLVLATKGEAGEHPDGFLAEGETLGERRVAETTASAGALGAAAVEFLGYLDSGMMGEPTNDAAGSFWSCDVDEAAARLAELLRRERADVLTIYDDHGNYGHPDHIKVHEVGRRAADIAGTPRVYEATMNRDHVERGMRLLAESEGMTGVDLPEIEAGMGVPEAMITTAVDVRPWLDRKRASMRAHASQIGEQSWWLQMPDDLFAEALGTEWYVRHGNDEAPTQPWETGLL